jgi:hypothetical protein
VTKISAAASDPVLNMGSENEITLLLFSVCGVPVENTGGMSILAPREFHP